MRSSRSGLRAICLLAVTGSLTASDTGGSVRLSDTALMTGRLDSVYLSIEAPEAIAGLQFSLNYDPDKLKVGMPVLSGANRHFSAFPAAGEGSLKVVAINLQGKTLDLSSAVLVFPVETKTKKSGSTELILKDFLASSPKGEKVSLRVSNGKVSIVTELPQRVRVAVDSRVSKKGEAALRLEFPRTLDFRLTICAATGKVLRQLRAGILPAGVHQLVWDGKNDAGSELPAGDYVCRLNVGQQEYSAPVTLRQ